MAVFGQAVGSLGSHVKTTYHTVVIMPSNVSMEAAATVPTVFITADTAFRHAISLTAEHRVLIHATAGEQSNYGCSSRPLPVYRDTVIMTIACFQSSVSY